jgi:hypothetical protein
MSLMATAALSVEIMRLIAGASGSVYRFLSGLAGGPFQICKNSVGHRSCLIAHVHRRAKASTS